MFSNISIASSGLCPLIAQDIFSNPISPANFSASGKTICLGDTPYASPTAARIISSGG
jgi:hypothetical protein